MAIVLDHAVIHVSDWERSNRFYRDVLEAEVVARGAGWAYRFGANQLNLHGPGVEATPLAQLPVQPGGSDICFVWPGPIIEAIAHLAAHSVTVELGPVIRFGARGEGQSVYFRDPDGSLLEFISYDPQSAASIRDTLSKATSGALIVALEGDSIVGSALLVPPQTDPPPGRVA